MIAKALELSSRGKDITITVYTSLQGGKEGRLNFAVGLKGEEPMSPEQAK